MVPAWEVITCVLSIPCGFPLSGVAVVCAFAFTRSRRLPFGRFLIAPSAGTSVHVPPGALYSHVLPSAAITKFICASSASFNTSASIFTVPEYAGGRAETVSVCASESCVCTPLPFFTTEIVLPQRSTAAPPVTAVGSTKGISPCASVVTA